MLDFIKKKMALLWAKTHVANSERHKKNAIKEQEKLLTYLLKRASHTEYGKKYAFAEIKDIADFQTKVPIVDYEDLRPYIDQIKLGKEDVLWPEKPLYLAKTSGTTSGSKYIPISKEGMPFQIQAAQSAILHYIHHKNNADFSTGKMIFIQGSPILDEISGIKTGRLSGIVAHHIPSYIQKTRLPSWETNIIEDWEEKVDAIVSETEKENMTLISGIPPWLIMYFEKLVEKHDKKIMEIFPNLQLIITGGVNYDPYREKMEELIGKPIDTIQTFPASEGFFGFQDDHTQEGLLLLTNQGVFYEFVPLEEYGKPSAKRIALKDIELDRDYALIISTNSGLWAYSIGDVVRFIDKNPYRILVTGRTKHFTSAFGEHVIAYEVEEAMKSTLAQVSAQISEFHLAPEVSPKEGLPHHEWLIEFEREPEDWDRFRETLDQELRKRNVYYDDLIQGNILQPLIITRLQKNAFMEYAKSQGKLGGQNKIPRLANDRKVADLLSKYRL